MKQRLLLALLMLFTSVGFVMGQVSGKAIKIVGTGPIMIELQADDLDKDHLPYLSKNGQVDEDLAPSYSSDEDLTRPVTYEFEGTGAPIYLIDREGVDYTNARLTINGEVTEFTVMPEDGDGVDNFNLATQLTSLTITSGVLETLTLGMQTDAASDCSYLPNLKSLNVQGNKLKHIPAKGNITSYLVGTQSPEDITIEIEERGEDNSIQITGDMLKNTGLFTVAPANLSIDFPDGITVEDDTNPYILKNSDGTFVSGKIPVTITLVDPTNYQGVVIENVILDIPEPEFTFHIKVNGDKFGSAKAYETQSTSGTEITDGSSIDVGTIWIYVEYEEEDAFISAVARENLDLVSSTVDDAGAALQPGWYEYRVTGLGDPSFEITFAEQAPDMANIATALDEGSATITLYDVDDDVALDNLTSVPLPQSVYAVVTAKTGYLPSKVDVVLGDGSKQTLTLTKEGNSYKSSTIALKEGVNAFTAISEQGATVSWYVSPQGAADGSISVKYNNSPVEQHNTTLEAKSHVALTIPTAAKGYELVSVTHNGENITGQDYSNIELEAGNNHFVATYRSILATDVVVYGATCEWELNPNEEAFENGSVSAGDDVKITLTPSADEKITGVEINGKKIEPEGNTYTGEAVAGQNVITVHMTVNPTLGKTEFPGYTGDNTGMVTVKQNDAEVKEGAALTEGADITVSVTPPADYKVDRVLFNGKELTLGVGGTYTGGEVKSGVNTVTVYYKSTVINEPTVEVVNGEKAWVEVSEVEGGKVTVTTNPGKGYGVEAVLLNALTSGDVTTSDQVEVVTANEEYNVTLQPGDNRITVVFTDKAIITTDIEGIEGYTLSDGDITISGVTNPDGTFEPNTTTITVRALETKTVGEVDYKLFSLTVNGKVIDNGDTHTLGVGTNHVVATYVSNEGTVLTPEQVGGKGTIQYKVGEDGTFSSTLPTVNAGDKVYVQVSETGDNALRSIYFNNTKLVFSEKDGAYTTTEAGTVKAGDNTLYVFYDDAAEIVKVTSDGGDVTYTPASLKKDTEVEFTVTPDEDYAIKVVYFNGENVTGYIESGKFTRTLRAGLNIIHAEFEALPKIVLTYDANAGEVSPNQDEIDDTEYTVGEEVTFTVTPKGDFNAVTATHNGAAVSVVDGKFTVTLVSGTNNIHVEFSKALSGNLIIKTPYGNVTDILLEEEQGDKTFTPEEVTTDRLFSASEVPAGSPMKITFKAPKPTDVNYDMTVVINARAYQPTWNEADEQYVLNNVYLLETSVMRIDVKKLKSIKAAWTNGNSSPMSVVYDGTAQTPDYITTVNGTKVLFNDIKVEYYEGDKRLNGAPTEVGTYKMTLSREADDEYIAFKEDLEYKITKAPLVVTQMPTVTVDLEKTGYPYVIANNGTVGYKTASGYTTVSGTFALANASEGHKSSKDEVMLTFTPDHNENVSWDETAQLQAYYTVSSTPAQWTISKANGSENFIATRNDNLILIDPTSGKNVKVDNDGTSINLAPVEVVEGCTYKFFTVDANGNRTEITNTSNVAVTSNLTIKLEVTDNRQTLTLDKAVEDQEVTYNGDVKAFDIDELALPDKAKDVDDWTITYAQGGVNVPQPIDAGTYDVTLVRAADASYKEFKTTGKLIIEKARWNDLMIEDPVASPIAIGQSLQFSNLAGAAELVGEYKWDDPTIVPSDYGSGGYDQNVKFYPFDTKNYDSPKITGDVHVTILDNPVVSWSGELGYVVITDSYGRYVQNGAVVDAGTVLNIQAYPLYPNKVDFESLVIDGESVGKAQTSVVFEGEESMEIVVTYKVHEEEPVYIPEGQYAVVLPESVRGAKVDKSGVYAVERGDDFTFTVTTLAADAGKVTVTVNGSALTGTNGKYTLTNVTERQDISISVSNPTEVKVNIPRSYHIEGQSEDYATVSVINNTANDGHYYFNDALTVIAFTHITGVDFARWSDNSREQVHEVVLDAAEYTLLASFTGLPTGIEDIESATVYTGKGFIMVKNVADAELTVVSISGRLQAKQEISGDTRIDVPQGIYVVVLQSGDEVKQLKVIVK